MLKSSSFIICITSILLAQPSNWSTTGLGMSFGSSYLVPGLVNTQYIYTGLLFYPTPNNYCLELFIPDGESCSFNFTVGYGFSEATLDYSYESGSSGRRATYITEGYPIEAKYLVCRPLAEGGRHTPLLGLGIGYYEYKTRITFLRDEINTNGEFMMRGLAQFFTVGWSTAIDRKLMAYLQIKKIGLKKLRVWEDLISYYDGDRVGITKRESAPSIGPTDFGIEFGCRMSLK